jgi:putative OPT family oligopeptide transporter
MSAPESHEPYVPASTSLPESSIPAIALAAILAIVLGAANTYLGLFAGMTVSASIPAAVISMAMLRLFRGNILQNNGVQTSAASGAGVAGGALFTIPALVMAGAWSRFNYWETTILVGAGGLLGVLFTIPLRRALIIESQLKFPEGVATAEVLKVGQGGGAGLVHVAVGGAVGAIFKLGSSGLLLWRETAEWATRTGGWLVYAGSNLSPALVGVGYICGLNVSLVVFAGGVTNWLIAIPLYGMVHGLPVDATALDAAGGIWSTQTRYLGVGGMLVGGVYSLIRLAPALARGIASSMAAFKGGAGQAVARTERDIPFQTLLIVVGALLVPLFFVFDHFAHNVPIALFMTAFLVIAGFIFSAVASYMAGLVGSSNNPISGVTIATVLCAALLLKLFGQDATVGPVMVIFLGAAVCCAAAIGGDNLQDLKAGHILGSTPWKQQLYQMGGVVAAMFVIAPVLQLMLEAYGIGPKTEAFPNSLTAPQATLVKSVAQGVWGQLPWTMVGIGAAIAACVVALDFTLEKKQVGFRTPVMAFAVGIYLPFELSVPIFVGGVIAHLAERALKPRSADAREEGGRNGLLFAAGLITGEALVGILLAIPIVISQNKKVMALLDEPRMLPGIALLAVVSWLLYRAARSAKAA